MSFWLLSIFALTKFVLILWLCAATIRLYVSLFKSPFWSQPQFCSLLTSLVCLKYWFCKEFFSQSCSLFSFFAFFKTLGASKPYTLSSLAVCGSLSSLPWTYTSKSLTANSIQSSILRWCRARDLLESQIPVTTEGFELRISYIRSSHLTH